MIKPLTDLSPTELRIRCAEVLGWRTKEDEGDPKYIQLINPKGFIESIIRFGTIQDFCDNGTLPDYLFNRNALQELIMAVPEEKRMHFLCLVAQFTGNGLEIMDEEIIKTDYRDSTNLSVHLWNLFTAPPEAIMRAFLTVMEEERDD